MFLRCRSEANDNRFRLDRFTRRAAVLHAASQMRTGGGTGPFLFHREAPLLMDHDRLVS